MPGSWRTSECGAVLSGDSPNFIEQLTEDYSEFLIDQPRLRHPGSTPVDLRTGKADGAVKNLINTLAASASLALGEMPAVNTT